MIKSKKLIKGLLAVVGVISILTGLLAPPALLALAFRPIDAVSVNLSDKLMLGTILFKIGLVVLGTLMIVMPRLPVWSLDNESPRPPASSSGRVAPVFLSVILLLALILRLYSIDSGLWHDEIATLINYGSLSYGEIISTYDSQNQHLLYSVLARACLQLFGNGAWPVRIPAALFGVGSIAAIYLLGREISDKKEALFAATLVTFSYHHIWFSQNARGYTGLLFWTLLSSWLFVRSLREKRTILWIYYAVTVAMGMYTQMGMAFVVVGQFIIFLVVYKSNLERRWKDGLIGLFFGFVLAGILTFQLYAIILPQVLNTNEEQNATAISDWQNPLFALYEIVNGLEVGFISVVIVVPAVLIFGVGLVSFFRTESIMVHLFIIPILTCLAVVIGIGLHIWPRFFFFSIGFGALIVVRGTSVFVQEIARLFGASSSKQKILENLACVGLILVSAMSVPAVYGPKQDFRSAFIFVEQNRKPMDAVVVAGLASFTYKNLYETNWHHVESIDSLDSIRTVAKRTWLIYTIPIHLRDKYPALMDSIEHDFVVVKKFDGTLNNGAIFVCLSDIPPSQALKINSY